MLSQRSIAGERLWRQPSPLSLLTQATRGICDPQGVMATAGECLKNLGVKTTFLLLDDDRERLYIAYHSADEITLQAIEELAGLSLGDFGLPVDRVGTLRSVLRSGKGTYTPRLPQEVADSLPHNLQALGPALNCILGLEQGITAPLLAEGEAIGLMDVRARDLGESDVGTIEAFALQVSTALHHARLMSKLHASQSRYHALFERMAEGVLLLDETGTALEANHQARAILGYNLDELQGANVQGLGLLSPFPSLATGPSGEAVGVCETRFHRRDGAILTLEVRTQPLRLCRSAGPVMVMLRDVTQARDMEKAAQRHRKELEILGEVGRLAASTLNIGEIFPKIAEEVGNLLPFDRMTLVVLSQDEAHVEAAITVGIPAPAGAGLGHFSLRGSLFELLRATGRPLLKKDLSREASLFPEEVLAQMGLRSLLVVPLTLGGEVVGLLAMACRRPDAYGDPDLNFAQRVASHLVGPVQCARLMKAERHRSQELAALYNIANTLIQPTSFKKRAPQVMRELFQVLQADLAMLWLLDSSKQQLSQVAIAGEPMEWAKRLPVLRLDQGVSGLAATTQQPVIANDYVRHPNATPESIAEGVRAVAALPIHRDRDILGVVSVASTHAGHFTPERVHLLAVICNQMGMLLENALLVEEERRRAEQLSLFHTVAVILRQPKPFEEKLALILDAVLSVAGTRSGAFRLAEGDVLRLVASKGVSRRFQRQRATVPIGETIPGVAAAQGTTIVVENAAQDERVSALSKREGFRSLMAIPIKSDKGLVGTFTVAAREPRYFGPHHVHFFTAIANGIGMAIENERLMEAERQRAQELAALYTIANTLIQPSGFEEKVSKVLAELVRIVVAHWGFFRMVDEEQREFRLIAVACSDPEAVTAPPVIPLGQGLVGLAYSERKVTVANDYVNHPNAISTAIEMGVKSAASVPVTAGQRVLAVLNVGAGQPNHFTPERVRLLATIGQEIGVLLENTLLSQKASQAEALQEVDRLRRQLLATVSHELRTPLTSIKGYASTLLQPDARWDSTTTRKFLTIIDQEADRLDRHVGDLLTMSQLEAGALKPEKGLRRFQEVMEPIAGELAALTRNHRLHLDVPKGLPRIDMDPKRIGQVVTNLVGNAVKFSPEGTTITVRAKATPEGLLVRVTDQGVGIPAHALDRVFDPFYRVQEGDSARKTGGSGLGLSICRGLIEAHGGKIWAQSGKDKGATLSFLLPTRAPGVHRHGKGSAHRR